MCMVTSLTKLQWHRVAGQPERDGFEFTRRGDVTIQTRISLQLEQQPDRYKLAPPLADLLQMKDGTRASIVAAVWNYIKINGLQDKQDRRVIKVDAKLQAVRYFTTLWSRAQVALQLAATETMVFHNIPELVDRYLLPPDPFMIYYNVTFVSCVA